MPKNDEVLVQLATRIPKSLHREIKLFCVEHGVSVMEFVSTALRQRLRRGDPGARRRTAPR
jgi:predicted HicB family RNase H-like nuclease